ncbi:MAG TPA: pilus assembly protein N-terminal domain-containing protein [Myxococcaceae bacterium]|nr:pilus assembly protein N-terminal domain-containing protein [Myxococcaceae bacterium]
MRDSRSLSLWERAGVRDFRSLACLGTLLGLFLLSLPLGAWAWPVDLRMPLEAGRERFHKLSAVDWVEVEDPTIATAEVLRGSNELFLTGVRPGRTLLLLYAEGKFAVWRLEVTEPGGRAEPRSPPEALAAARKACPGLKATERGPERALVATVKEGRCREALRGLLRTDAFVARELELTFELPVLQEQLAEVASALEETGLKASYSGAGLLLEGEATPEVHRRALWELFRRSVGRVALEDRVKPAPDAGAQEDAGTPADAVR